MIDWISSSISHNITPDFNVYESFFLVFLILVFLRDNKMNAINVKNIIVNININKNALKLE